jgi:hypothetical protein
MVTMAVGMVTMAVVVEGGRSMRHGYGRRRRRRGGEACGMVTMAVVYFLNLKGCFEFLIEISEV